MERQALRDAVVRYNAAGLAGLYNRPKPGRAPRLSEAEQAAHIFRGPDPEKGGVSAWTRADLCGWLEARFGKTFHPSSLSRVLRRLDLSRRKTRPVHPRADPAAQARFQKRGCAVP